MRLSPLLALLACAAWGCVDKGSTDSTAGDDTAVDSEESGDNGAETDVTVTLDDATAVQNEFIDTVMRVSWTTSEAGDSVVEWGLTGSYGHTTVATGNATTTHEVLVVGLPPNATVHWRARSVVNGETLVSEGATVTTSLPEQGLPDGTLATAVDGQYTPGLRLVPLPNNPSPIVLLGDDGQPSWWTYAERDLTVTDAQVARDGRGILYLVQDKNRRDDIGGLVRVDFETPETSTFIPLTYCHHGFVQLPDGRFAYIGLEIREVDRSDVYGDTIILVEADGSNPQVIWSAWDQWEVDMTTILKHDGGFYPEGLDWTHGNSLQYNEALNTLVFSTHNLSAALHLELDGTVLWQVGGEDSDLNLVGGETAEFHYQHNPQLIDEDTLIMFDNGDFNDRSSVTEVSEYTLDEAGGSYERTWTWNWTGDEVTYLMGDVQRLPNGNTFTNWGASGTLIEVTAAGEEVWRWDGSLGSILGFSDFHTSLGVPLR